MHGDNDSDALPDADAEYGLPLAEAIVAFSDAALNEMVNAALAAYWAAARALPADRRGPPSALHQSLASLPENAAVRDAIAARARAFKSRLRAGELEAHFTDTLINPDWRQWRPEDWAWLRLQILSTHPDHHSVRSPDDDRCYFGAKVRVRQARNVGALASAQEAAAPLELFDEQVGVQKRRRARYDWTPIAARYAAWRKNNPSETPYQANKKAWELAQELIPDPPLKRPPTFDRQMRALRQKIDTEKKGT